MALLDDIAEKKRAIDATRPMPYKVVAELADWFERETTVGAVLVESARIARADVVAVLESGTASRAAPADDQKFVTNHRRALELLARLSRRPGGVVSEQTIVAFHGMLYRGIDRRAGQFREGPLRGDLPAPAPDAAKIKAAMTAFSGWLRRSEPTPDAAIEANHRLMAIRPFEQGNAAVSLLLTNLILSRAGYPPVAIREADVGPWREAMQRALAFSDRAPFHDLMLELMKQSLDVCLVAAAGSLAAGDGMPLRS